MATLFSITPRNRATQQEKIGERAIDQFLDIQDRINDLAVEERFTSGLGTVALRQKIGDIKKSTDALLHTLYILEGFGMK